MSSRPTPPDQLIPPLGWTLGLMLLVTLGTALHLSIVLETTALASAYFGVDRWKWWIETLGGEWDLMGGEPFPVAGLGGPFVCSSLGFAGLWLWSLGRNPRQALEPTCDHLVRTGWLIASWGLLPTFWAALWLVSSFAGLLELQSALVMVQSLVLPLGIAGAFHAACRTPAAELPGGYSKTSLWCAMGLYVVVFVALNWGLWFSLRLPHGDSAMYEEHLWNLEHGQGFRSYLDQGLFLGEHIQFVHAFLIPLHWLWPSHLLLELCESLALASAALPIHRLARRASGSETAALWLAGAYLGWFGVHYLDIAIDLKTFRPSVFGVPLMLWWIDCWETGRWRTGLVLLLLTLTCQEDFTIVMAPVALWFAVAAWRSPVTTSGRRMQLVSGLAMAAGLTLYLVLVLKVFLPYFRSGVTIHYASYFSAFGNTPQEIVLTMLTRPDKTLGLLLTPGAMLYALYLLVPLGGLPLRSPGRLLTGLPLFLTLCLNELIRETPGPFHHFHAPLVPILFWSAAGGLQPARAASRVQNRWNQLRAFWFATSPVSAARLACYCALATGVVFSTHPGSLRFWDPGRGAYWRDLYLPGERARQFAKIEPLIPVTARVASTDFVHPRFTHHARSYDYSDYPRAVANYEDRVPFDTEYIVLDTRHPYSKIRSLRDPIRELQREPDCWEVLPDETDGYFIVLKRVRPSPAAPATQPTSLP